MNNSLPGTIDYSSIINRRKWTFLIACIVGLVSSVVYAFSQPLIYKSTSKIFVHKSEIRSDYVKENITSFVEERVRLIKQQILNPTRLKETIEQYKLYPDLQKNISVVGVVNLIRRNFKIRNITEKSQQKRLGRQTIAIAFSYEDHDPKVAQQMAKLLTAIFLEENINIRQRQTSETTLFLENEMNKLKKELDVIEEHVSTFKKQYINELPPLMQVNLQRLQVIEGKRDKLQEELLKKKAVRQDLKVQLSSIPKHSMELSEHEKFLAIETQLANLRSQYTEAYPDVIKLKAELVDLKEKIKEQSNENHNYYLSNPAYVTLNVQISMVSNEIISLRRQIKDLETNENKYQKRIETTLRIEDEYNALMNRQKNMLAKHNDLMKKLMDAKISHGLEEEQIGERFILVDPAKLPRHPYKPNRRAIILLGCLFGLGLGIGIAAIQEFLDHSIRDENMLANISSGPVLGSIPIIISDKDIAGKRRNRLIIVTMVLVVSVGIFLALTYLLPFNVFEKIKEAL